MTIKAFDICTFLDDLSMISTQKHVIFIMEHFCWGGYGGLCVHEKNETLGTIFNFDEEFCFSNKTRVMDDQNEKGFVQFYPCNREWNMKSFKQVLTVNHSSRG